MPQPVRAFVDGAGEAWLVMDNGQRISLPTAFDSGNGNGGSTPVTDHGALTGLADNDHPQYVRDTGDTMTGALIQATDTSSGSSQGIEIRSSAYPALMLHKTSAPADQHLWKMYASGAAGAANALTFLPMDDDPLTPVPAIRMQRDGRVTLGTGPTADLDAATKEYVDAKFGTAILGESANAYVAGTAVRSGDIVTLSGYWAFKASGTATAQVPWLIGYVPVGFRPIAEAGLTEAVVPGLWWPNSSYDFKPCAIKIGTNGNLSFIPFETTAYTTAGGTYLTGVVYKGA